jgi:uncharacterized membrane protein
VNALDQYRYATQRWRQANAERDRAAQDRAAALAAMARDGLDDETIARRVRLSPNRVRQLIDKTRTPQTVPHGPQKPRRAL